MIRRNPTLIAMSDLDVQDVRDHVRRKKEGAQASAAPSQPPAGVASVGMSISTDPSKPVVAAEDAKRKREAMSKEERLGL